MNKVNHILIIPDGNRRFCKKNNLKKHLVYEIGRNKLKEIVDYISDNYKEIRYLTIYILSYDNIIKRTLDEINIICDLISSTIDKLYEINKNYKYIFSSDESLLDENLLNKMKNLELETATNTGLCINLQIGYGSRQSIIKSVNNLISNNIEVTEKSLSRELTKSLTSYEENMPDPDIIIRTSGETRVSNEMLWEIAYSEIFFIDKLWPEITTDDIDSIINTFKNKERRFGK